jgi:hypothetical protein
MIHRTFQEARCGTRPCLLAALFSTTVLVAASANAATILFTDEAAWSSVANVDLFVTLDDFKPLTTDPFFGNFCVNGVCWGDYDGSLRLKTSQLGETGNGHYQLPFFSTASTTSSRTDMQDFGGFGFDVPFGNQPINVFAGGGIYQVSFVSFIGVIADTPLDSFTLSLPIIGSLNPTPGPVIVDNVRFSTAPSTGAGAIDGIAAALGAGALLSRHRPRRLPA